MIYLWVGLAGALGSILRYIIGISLFTNNIFPWATLAVNLFGSFLLAFLTTVIFKKIPISPTATSAIGTGFVGSFTTFSTLSVETVALFNNSYFLLGLIYVLVSMVGGIFMCRMGFRVAKEVDNV
jgi:fluoride exporter